MFRKILTTIGLIALWALVVAAAFFIEAMWFGEPPVERGNFASIENYLVGKMRDAAEDKRLGSAALVLMQNGEIVSKHGFGVSNAETQAPVNPDQTLFQLASVSKAVTAFGVMKLVEENKIGLDEPAMRYLKRWQFPGSENYRDKVTVRHLLTHTAGLYDGARFGVVEPNEKMPTLEESMNAAAPGELKIIAEPGTAFIYGNGNSAVLQMLIEDVTGKPFADYMKETVLQPLGMTESSFDAESVAQNIAPDFDSSLKVHPRRRYTATGAVALYATATDVARFARAFTGENPVLKRETIKQMLAPQNGTNGTWGLGQTLYVENGAGGFIAGHDGGAIPAWGAAMRFNPATGNGFVMLVSGGSGAVNRLPHDWIYWETGKMIYQAKRQVFYDRMKGSGFAVLVLGSIVIVFWRVFASKYRHKG
jgi:CubicO group peptidase (beta-lactamase class C family)